MKTKEIKNRKLVCIVLISSIFTIPAFSNLSECAPVVETESFDKSPWGVHSCVGNWKESVEIGVTWDRPGGYVIWMVKGTYPNYDFRDADKYLKASGNIQLMWNIGDTRLLPPDNIPQKGLNSKIVAIVERYDGDGVDDMPGLTKPVKYWQVGNECNEKIYPNYMDFVRLVNVGYNSVKYSDPDAVVVLSGVGTGLPANINPSWQKLYLPAIRAGVKFDVFDYHWYGRAVQDVYKADYRKWGSGVYIPVRSALDTYGYKDVPIWSTEMGTYSGTPKGYPYQSEEAHAGDVVRRYIYPLTLGDSNLPLGVKIFWCGIKEVVWAGDPDHYFSHVQFIFNGRGTNDRGDGVPKIAYFTFKLMTSTLGAEPVYDHSVSGWRTGCYGYRFLVNGRRVYAIWNDSPTPQSVTLSGLNSSTVNVTKALTDTQGNVTSWTQVVSGGSITLNLEPAPQAYWVTEEQPVGGNSKKQRN